MIAEQRNDASKQVNTRAVRATAELSESDKRDNDIIDAKKADIAIAGGENCWNIENLLSMDRGMVMQCYSM